MEHFEVYNLLKNSADKWPNNPAIHDELGTMNFDELLSEVEALKLQLSALGITQGMGVGVMARNSRNFIVSVFAVLGCGAAVMPVSHQLKRPEIEDILENAKLHAILDDCSGIEPVPENENTSFRTKNGELRFAFTSVPFTLVFAKHVKAPAFIRFTSGTTGTSKGVIIGNQAVIERTQAANKSLALGPESNVIWVLPMAYHFVVSIVLYVRYGSAITIVKDFMADSVIEMTNRFEGTMLYASPMQIRLLAANRGEVMLPSLQKIISTSSGINAEISKMFKKRFGKTVHQAFGIIEIGLPIINTEEKDDFYDAVGYSLPDFDVQIFDADYNKLSRGQVGMLGIKGPGMFSAYLSPPTLREELLVNGYFLTADYASISENGMIKIEGRKKSMINVSGNKVFAEEVEKVLEQLDYISLSRVSGVPHPLMGQIIQAEIVLKNVTEIDIEEVLTYCRKRLSTYKIPQKLVIVKSLEMTGSGKVKR
ncbi:MAG: class I adenylate-forming enzyme family protein [Crocinitomicaceae bacterium]|nr:class I adenylate-forming enzyme family protein [Crocinitomicaceae bacterium]